MNHFETADRQTRNKLADYETALRSAPINTCRGLDEIAATLGFESGKKLGQTLKGKDTLDLGSGYCGMAIDAYLRDFSHHIHSLSPSAANFDFERHRLDYLFRKGFSDKYPPVQIEAAIKHVNDLTYAYLAHDLPFQNYSFDLIIDNWAVNLYADEAFGEFYEAGLHEAFRVLRPGGQFLIGDPEHNQSWKRETLTKVCRHYRTNPQPIFNSRYYQVGYSISA